MNYIKDLTTFDKIKELARKGDKEAQDFILNFREMDDEEVNKYLSSFGIPTIIDDLIKDEEEAIKGYDNAIDYIEKNKVDCDTTTLKHIRDEEIEHIKELKEILKVWRG